MKLVLCKKLFVALKECCFQAEKREQLRKDLQFDKILPNKIIPNKIIPSKIMQVPSAFSPMVAMEIEKLGFPAVYISGAVLSADLGLPDIGLTTLNEVAERGKQIARVTNLPCIIDADTGFGEPMNVARTVLMFEEVGTCWFALRRSNESEKVRTFGQ